ncbi:peptidylprolyl isomerase [Flavobacterium psychrophilum]|nr:Peptidyl-prolyl cis-trans isomerase [Flavobacterium psychrophilum]GAQ48338.1 peptidylprolyl isomerase [Flavobacterium psychrophilum]GAW88811.1 peptidylprolyl isomerase [Flavobacterium psychrophilum]GEJ30337.1 peptidylprolyl isomerase [Flavobacterium psychrophilum]GEJ34230.1 peptidylprolyl isomerase [Flavobacterium psychrophilum]
MAINNFKMNIISSKLSFIIALLAISLGVSAQEKKQKVDGVIAVVGNYVILDSDIDKTTLELKQQGVNVKDVTRCQLLGKLLEDKLYAHHAIQDSIVIEDKEVNSKLDEQVSYMVEQLGSMDKVIQYFKKSNEQDFRTELFDIIKINKLTAEMQKKVVDAVIITPEEVRNFFKAIPKADLPVFGAEMEVAQIVVKPTVSQEAKQKVIDQLKAIKKEVQEGSSFFGKAVLYSEDKGSSSNGGYYKMDRRTQFVKEFKDVAFGLKEGEISEPFLTDFGYHIIYLEKIRGQEVDLRHIVISPKVSDEALKVSKEKIELIRKRILDKEITFSDAARTMSDEKETRNDGGVLTNPKTQDTRFELTKMDPALYSQVSNLKDNQISNPIIDEDRTGGKFYKIVTVTNRYDEHTADYSKDYIRLKELALKEKQIKAIAKWSEEKIKETHIKINSEYRDCVFTNNWLKK